MKCAVLVLGLISAASTAGFSQEHRPENFIRLAFKVDGKATSCKPLKIQLGVHNQTVTPEQKPGGFWVPDLFLANAKKWDPNDKATVTVVCGGYTLDFEEHPSLITGGDWEAGIRYPQAWIEYAYTNVIEHGNWVSYLTVECNGCDPGVVTYRSHPDFPEAVASRLRRDQATATGQSARDIAYALAVFNIEYARNRDYLLGVLADCLGRSKESSEDDVCDGHLLAYVVNLYWRGDKNLLPGLLQDADERRDVIDDIGSFYANLLDRQPKVAIDALETLTPEKQKQVCRLAGDFELHLDSQKLERVSQNLHAIGSDVAERCLATSQNAAAH